MDAGDIRETYDAVARAYDERLRDELDHKPLDRALLDALAELTREAPGPLADIGCGPGHVSRYLAGRHPDVIGVDLSPAMIEIARAAAPRIPYSVGSMLDLPAMAGDWAGAVAFYSIIHLDHPRRTRAFAELARVLRPGGWLLLAFHVDGPEHRPGESIHLSRWFDEDVDIETYFLDPGDVAGDLARAGFEVTATLTRAPDPAVEYPSHRGYLLARRPAH